MAKSCWKSTQTGRTLSFAGISCGLNENIIRKKKQPFMAMEHGTTIKWMMCIYITCNYIYRHIQYIYIHIIYIYTLYIHIIYIYTLYIYIFTHYISICRNTMGLWWFVWNLWEKGCTSIYLWNWWGINTEFLNENTHDDGPRVGNSAFSLKVMTRSVPGVYEDGRISVRLSQQELASPEFTVAGTSFNPLGFMDPGGVFVYCLTGATRQLCRHFPEPTGSPASGKKVWQKNHLVVSKWRKGTPP